MLLLDNLETPWDYDKRATEKLIQNILEVAHTSLVVTLRGRVLPFGINWGSEVRVPLLTLKAARAAFLKIAGDSFKNDPLLDELIKKVDNFPLAIALLAHLAQGEPNLSSVWGMWRERKTDAVMHLTNSLELSILSPRMTDDARRLLSILAILPGGIAWRDIPTLLPESGHGAAATLRKVGLAYDVEMESRLQVLSPIREHLLHKHPPTEEDCNRTINHYFNLTKVLTLVEGKIITQEADRQIAAEASNVEAVTHLYSALMSKLSPHTVLSAYAQAAEFTRSIGSGSPHKLELQAQKSNAVGTLIEMMHDDYHWQEAAEALIDAGALSVPALETAVNTGDWLLRRRAVGVLQAIESGSESNNRGLARISPHPLDEVRGRGNATTD